MRLFLLTLFVLCFNPASAWAEDYLLNVETFHTRLQPRSGKLPEKTVPHNMEIRIQPDVPFHSKVRLGKETLTLAGKLSITKEENLILDVSFQWEYDTGDKVVVRPGVWEPVLDTEGISTTIGVVELDQQTILGGAITKNDDPNHPKHGRIESRHFATLTKYQDTAKNKR